MILSGVQLSKQNSGDNEYSQYKSKRCQRGRRMGWYNGYSDHRVFFYRIKTLQECF